MLGQKEAIGAMREKVLLDYDSYMAHFVCRSGSPTPSPSHSGSGSPLIKNRVRVLSKPLTQHCSFVD